MWCAKLCETITKFDIQLFFELCCEIEFYVNLCAVFCCAFSETKAQ